MERREGSPVFIRTVSGLQLPRPSLEPKKNLEYEGVIEFKSSLHRGDLITAQEAGLDACSNIHGVYCRNVGRVITLLKHRRTVYCSAVCDHENMDNCDISCRHGELSVACSYVCVRCDQNIFAPFCKLTLSADEKMLLEDQPASPTYSSLSSLPISSSSSQQTDSVFSAETIIRVQDDIINVQPSTQSPADLSSLSPILSPESPFSSRNQSPTPSFSQPDSQAVMMTRDAQQEVAVALLDDLFSPDCLEEPMAISEEAEEFLLEIDAPSTPLV